MTKYKARCVHIMPYSFPFLFVIDLDPPYHLLRLHHHQALQVEILVCLPIYLLKDKHYLDLLTNFVFPWVVSLYSLAHISHLDLGRST